MQFTDQKAEQPANTACLLARIYHWLAGKMASNMRNATCARTETLKLPTWRTDATLSTLIPQKKSVFVFPKVLILEVCSLPGR